MTSLIHIPDAYRDPDLIGPVVEDCLSFYSQDTPTSDLFQRLHHGHIRACAATAVESISLYGSAAVDVTPGNSTVYAAVVIDQQVINSPHRDDNRWAVSFGHKHDGPAGRVFWGMQSQPFLPTDSLIQRSSGTERLGDLVPAWLFICYLTNMLTGMALPWLAPEEEVEAA